MDAFSTLLKVFFDEQGALRYPAADVEHVIPWMLVNLPVDLGVLDEPTLILFAQASEKAGIKDAMDAQEIRDAFDAWYLTNPPSPVVVAALQEAWRQVHEGSGPAPFAGFLGEKASTGVLGGGVRPQGTVPGALARLAAMTNGTPPKKP
ncbi:MAG: hypothetical protein IT383_15445 [Deltaproteobacteria bacterium]|nr:hypothetical protein [Deltaproteobacteria bacterium]